MSDQHAIFSDYHFAVRKEIKDLGQELTENKESGKTNLSNESCISKIEALMALCQHVLNLKEAIETHSQNTGAPLSGDATEWCNWCEEAVRLQLERMKMNWELPDGEGTGSHVSATYLSSSPRRNGARN